LAIDTHVHLDASAFTSDLSQVLDRAAHTGVTRMVTIGTDLESSKRALGLAQRYPSVWASAGVHPHESEHCPATLEDELAALAQDPRVVAIGETGLDFYRDYAPRDCQREVFARQVAVALRLDLPLIIHSREASEEVVSMLDGAGATKVVMHCFTGDRALARRCSDRGWYLAFGGAATYPRNEELRAAVAEAPADRILFETDAPYMAPVPHRGRRNEPAWLVDTIAQCAAVRRTSAEALSQQAEQNAGTIFGRLLSHPTEES